MRLVHRTDDGSDLLATDVEIADSLLARMRGLAFRRSIPEDYALLFRFGRPASRTLHMVFVPFPIDALWLRDGEVTAVKRLSAWTGIGRGVADTVVELPAGVTDDVAPGDEVALVADTAATSTGTSRR